MQISSALTQQKQDVYKRQIPDNRTFYFSYGDPITNFTKFTIIFARCRTCLLYTSIVSEVLHSRNYNPDLRKLVKGVMIESYLLEGRQDTIQPATVGTVKYPIIPISIKMI